MDSFSDEGDRKKSKVMYEWVLCRSANDKVEMAGELGSEQYSG